MIAFSGESVLNKRKDDVQEGKGVGTTREPTDKEKFRVGTNRD